MQAEGILQIIVDWAKKQPTIQAVAVVGSHARGTARAESDIDLVLLVTRARRERECHLYFARRVTFPSCADIRQSPGL